MRAIILGSTGAGPTWLERHDVEPPQPEENEVVVEVRAAALNHADLDELAGTYASDQRRQDRPHIVGSDVAGVVTSVGGAVSGVQTGDRVMAMVEGAFADQVAFDHRLALPVPDALDWPAAAALPSALMTEYDALLGQGQLAAGQDVLITAATSGVGLIALDIARWAGANQVFATTTSSQKELLLTARGARAVNTRGEDLAGTVLAATGGRGVDLVIDHVGGAFLDACIAATRIGGAVVQVGRAAGPVSTIDVDRLAHRRVHLIGTTFRTRGTHDRARIAEAIRTRLLPAVADRRIRPHVHEVLPAAQAEKAREALAKPTSAGKIVLDFR
ncbi:zinc-binding dehydrogenase [Saccharopolyspora sp. WRP15-2]|uniref:Zinc-binding dehydrogenase n=1 Tax=Saccharopolyspora oryzae TaxID=2997343 RepID=A0ABT4UZX8_9PSEU|nr:zinc-binding dehydrogenase [Saccharopolyspora oryzae]MDA3627253.1 zinc-binding dehydrogenase [Saccharopolyspora oryzae]